MIPETNAAIEAMIALVEQKAKELADLKRATNVMCRQLRRPEIFAEVEEEIGGGLMRLRPDQFYGKSPIVAAREYLELRHEAVRAEEVLEALTRGGFDFSAQNWPEKERFRLLALSLSKNTAIFHKLPNGSYGLLKWYPEKEKRQEAVKPAVRPQTKPSTKAPAKARPKPSARQSLKRDAVPDQGGEAASAPSRGAVERAIEACGGQFTIDDVLPRLAERERDRAKVRVELNRLAEDGSRIRLVKKGALNQPAVYEKADTGGSPA